MFCKLIILMFLIYDDVGLTVWIDVEGKSQNQVAANFSAVCLL